VTCLHQHTVTVPGLPAILFDELLKASLSRSLGYTHLVLRIQLRCADGRPVTFAVGAEHIPYGHDHRGTSVLPSLKAAVKRAGVSIVVRHGFVPSFH